MKHIVSFSGGKDSTAMLLRMLEEKMPIDEIIYCDTGKDFPEMHKHIKQVDEYIYTNYGTDNYDIQSRRLIKEGLRQALRRIRTKQYCRPHHLYEDNGEREEDSV